MDIDSIMFPMCDNAVESTSHLFFTCHIARDIFRKISRWWDFCYMEVSSYEEWLVWLVNLRLSIKYKKILEGVAMSCGGIFGLFAIGEFLVRRILQRR